LLGSVAQCVLHSATCPVEIARSDTKKTLQSHLDCDGRFAIFSCCCALCGSTPMGARIRIPAHFSNSIHVASCRCGHHVPTHEGVSQRSGCSRRSTGEARGRCASLAQAKLILEELAVGQVQVAETVRDDPRRAILAEAKAFHPTDIVTGSHGWHGLDRILLGSVSEHVAIHASCSVTVVPR
jgi:nucleotide-binding universal stress UspA family protein